MTHNRPVTAYVVRAVNWMYDDSDFYRDDEAGEQCIRTFLSRENAEAHCRELELKQRRDDWPTFDRMGGSIREWENDTSHSPEEIAARLREVGMDPPDDPAELFEWVFYESRKALTPVRQDALWEVFDRRRFFEVVPIEIELQE